MRGVQRKEATGAKETTRLRKQQLNRRAAGSSRAEARGSVSARVEAVTEPIGSGNVVRRLKQLAAQIRVCTKCPLCESRTMAVPGEGAPKAEFMIIGEAPGKDEDKTSHPFVGSAGRYLDHVLEGTGIQRSGFFITNIVKCRPPNNRPPKAHEVETCITNYLMEQIELIDPHLILLLGSTAVKTVLSKKSVEEARGTVVELNGRKYLATYHPAARFYREDLGAKIAEDFALLKSEIKKFTKP